MIRVVCSHCGLRIMVPPTVQGKQGICFNCGQVMVVPGATEIEKHANLDFSPGDRIADRYTVEALIGKGGMGVVHRAEDTLVGESVALKFMLPKLLSTEKGQKLFIKEAQVARRLRHDNIVAVHDVSWTSDGILYLSMEFAPGQSLRSFLRQQRRDRRFIDVRFAVSITQQVLRALEYAHKMVVHRDIKPENIMILQGEKVKVLDFGLAAVHEEVMKKKEEEEDTAKKKRMVGTLAYAAPEQRKLHDVDSRADIYSVGMVLAELFTLRTPMDEPVEVADVRPDVAPSLLAVLEKALAEEKDQRWQTARDFRKALETAFESSYKKKAPSESAAAVDGDVGSTEGMVFMEGGRFLMGNDAVREEKPEHEIKVDPFYIDKYPVTVEQYMRFVEATGALPPKYIRDGEYNGLNQPVVGVTWEEACAYAAWAGKSLASEVQWEFAARGRENRTYPWGNFPPSATLANFKEFLGMPSIVTMHDEGNTPEGVGDMAGNVSEWCLEPFSPYKALRSRPMDEIEAPRRVVRGGSWSSQPDGLRCSHRKGLFPETRLPTVGFRCVIDASKVKG